MPEMTATEALLAERCKTHGDFGHNAFVAQSLKEVLRNADGYSGLNSKQREALDFICSKIGRIMSGQPGFQDHWDDIAGYAKLVSQDLQRK